MIADRRSQIADRRIADLIAICDLGSAIKWRPAFMFYLLRSSAIVCDHDRRIADDRRSMFSYDRRRSQTIADLIAICDLRSAIIWKPALNRMSSESVAPSCFLSNLQSLRNLVFSCCFALLLLFFTLRYLLIYNLEILFNVTRLLYNIKKTG